jgi:5-methylcytosine-specific restriction endonuclease McrBC regulatory subunit McrC
LKRSDGSKKRKLKPDVFLRSRGTPCLIADARWREDDKPRQKNLYQVTAYQRKTTSPGVIFYPDQGGQIEGTFEITQATVENTWTDSLRVVELPLGADTYEDFERKIEQTISEAIEELL